MAGQTIQVSVLADTRKFSSAMKNLGNETGLSKLGSKFKNAGSKIAGMVKTGVKTIGVLGIAIAGLALKGGFDRMMKIENAQAKLKGLGHDAKSVDKIMGDALGSVKGTAYGLETAATVAAATVAAGIKPGQELERVLSLTADAATIAGTGMDEMGNIFNKVAAKNKASMMEINQLTQRGIPIMQWLADEYGVTAEEASKMVSSGEVDFATFSKLMETNIGGAALEAGNTTEGAWANMKAAASRAGAAMLNDVFPMFKDAFTGITGWLDTLTDKIQPVGEAFSKWLADVAIPAVKSLGEWLSGTLLPALRELWDILSGAFKTAVATVSDALKDAGASAGQMGSSISDTLVKALSTAGPILANLITGIGSFVGWMIKSKDVLIPIAAGIGAMVVAWAAFNKVMRIAAAVQLAYNVVMAANPIGIIVIAIVGLVAAIAVLWNQNEGFRDAVTAIWDGITEFFSAAVEKIKEFLQGAWDFIQEMWSYSPLGLIIENWDAITEFFSTAVDVIKDVFQGIWNFIKTVWKYSPYGLILGNWKKILDFFGKIPGKIKGFFNSAISWLKGFGSKILQGLLNGIKAYWTTVASWYRAIGGKIKGFFSAAGNWLLSAGKSVIRGMYNGVKDMWTTVVTWLKGRKDAVKNAISGAATWLLSAGKDVISGFTRGLRNSAGTIITTIKNSITDKIPGFVKDALGIASPSRVFMDIAKWIPLGISKGIESKAGTVTDAMGEIVSDLTKTNFRAIGVDAVAEFGKGVTAKKVPLINAQVDDPNDYLNKRLEHRSVARDLIEAQADLLAKQNVTVTLDRGALAKAMSGTYLTLMVDGKPMKAMIQTEVSGSWDGMSRTMRQVSRGGRY